MDKYELEQLLYVTFRILLGHSILNAKCTMKFSNTCNYVFHANRYEIVTIGAILLVIEAKRVHEFMNYRRFDVTAVTEWKILGTGTLQSNRWVAA